MYFYSSNPQIRPRWTILILWSLVILLLGVFILVDTHDFAEILARAFGLFQLISGVLGLFIFFRYKKSQEDSRSLLLQSIMRTLVGIAALFLPLLVAGISWVLILYLLAAQFLISAAIDFSVAWRVERTGFPLGVSVNQHYANAASSFLVALILVLAPRFIGLFLLNMIAILMIMVGGGMLVFFVRLWWMGRAQNKNV